MPDILIKGNIKIVAIRYNTNGFGICVVSPVEMEVGGDYTSPTLDKYDTFFIKGSMGTVRAGEVYSILAKEVNDPKYNLQYQLIFINQTTSLTSPYEQKIFLSKLVTPTQLSSLYECIDDPFEAIKNEEIDKLAKVKGLGITTAYRLIEKYKATIDYSKVYVKFDSLGLTDSMIKKLCTSYGSPEALIEKFENDPYILCKDIDGIGFKKADEYALKYGMERDSPNRIRAFVRYVLNEESQKGNSWVDTKQLVEGVHDNLGVMDKSLIGKTLVAMKDLWWSGDKKRMGLIQYHTLESKIAKELLRLLGGKNTFEYSNWEETIQAIEQNIGFEYTGEQKAGVKTVLDNNVVCVTGLSGTGKTTITKAMLEILKTYLFAQCSLSGKASQRMFEVTGYEGFTIHRLLGFLPPCDFMYNDENQLPHDIIVIDEASMIGGDLFLDLIKSIRTGSKLIILGDSGQLSSIGACNVFHDLLTNGITPVVRLNKIHRQAQKSAIITEAYKVRKQQYIFEKGYEGNQVLGELQDLELDIYTNNEESAKKILMQFKKKLSLVESILDIQVIVPMKERGDICTFRLNNAMQKMYNPDGDNGVELSISKDKKYTLKEGDKVINMKNNYKAVTIKGDIVSVFNGNIGLIEKINKEDSLMVINFEGIGRLVIDKSQWRNILLAYAITGHKFQGSESNYIIVGLDYSAYKSLCCEWLYTAITRAKKYCVLVGENKAIRYSISQSKTPIKQTFLCELLNEYSKKIPETQD